MQKLLSYLFTSIIALQVICQVFMLLYFACNKGYIANNLCVNRNQPTLKCNGKCYLKKILKHRITVDISQQDQQEESTLRTSFGKCPLFFAPSSIVVTDLSLEKELNSFTVGSSSFELVYGYFYLYYPSTFHPPTTTA